MKSGVKGFLSLAALTLVGAGFAASAGAQGVVYTSPTTYGLLNGEHLALYINRLGDLGAPRINGSKVGGVLVNGVPQVNPDGSIIPGNGTYGALYSVGDTSAPTIGQSVQKKHEYITVGPSFATEGYSIQINGGSYLHNNSLVNENDVNFSATGTFSGLLTSQSSFTRPVGQGSVGITQTISFQDGIGTNRAKFTVNFDNTAGNQTNTFRYARVVNPNQGDNLQTNQSFLTPSAPNAFAINASAFSSQTGSLLNLGLGIDPNDNLMAHGATILATDASQSESQLLSDPDRTSDGQGGIRNNYVHLDAGDWGADYVFQDIDGNVFTAHSNDYRTLPFLLDNQVVTPVFDTGQRDTALILLSDPISVAAGSTGSFTFYYFFDTPNGGPTVPEPSALSLVAGCLVSGGLFARRRRK